MRRNDLDICADILSVARAGAKKTHIVYKANLNFNIVKKYLRRLKESGFIESENGSFFVTEEGIRFLQQYRDFMSPFPKNNSGD